MCSLRTYRAERHCISACGFELGTVRHANRAPITSGTDGGRAYALRNSIPSLSDLVGVVHPLSDRRCQVFRLDSLSCLFVTDALDETLEARVLGIVAAGRLQSQAQLLQGFLAVSIKIVELGACAIEGQTVCSGA